MHSIKPADLCRWTDKFNSLLLVLVLGGSRATRTRTTTRTTTKPARELDLPF
jgi:hypothetical protein